MPTLTMSLTEEAHHLLAAIGVPAAAYTEGDLIVRSPISGEEIARVTQTTPEQASEALAQAQRAFAAWRTVPAPRRGELVRILGEELRAELTNLGLR